MSSTRWNRVVAMAAGLGFLASCSGGSEIVAPPPAPPDLRGTTVAPDGVSIAYRVVGDGGPTLVLVHGWACDSATWDAQVEQLAGRFRLVTVDLAGHGASGANRDRWTISAFAGDVQAVLEALDLRDVILIGHSLGGPVTVEVARRAPDRVAGLIPVETLHDATFRFEPGQLEEFLTPFREDFVTAMNDFVRGFFEEGSDPVLVARIAGEMGRVAPEVAIPSLEGLFDYDLGGALSEVGVPIRVINAARMPTEVEANRAFAPQFEVVTMDGVGHFPMRERPAEFNHLLEQTASGMAAGGNGG